MTKLLLTALAAATIVLCSQARAFDGNDRLLSVDKYQALPANHSEIPNSYDVAEYRPYGSQVGAFEQLGEAIDSMFSPEPTYVQEPVAYYRPLDGTVRNSSYHLRRAASRETVAYGYRSGGHRPRDYACGSRVTAGPQLSRPLSVEWARGAAKKAWRREVTARMGANYAALSFAKGARMECTGGGLIRCEFSAIPCRAG
jgi:hypothetical protein